MDVDIPATDSSALLQQAHIRPCQRRLDHDSIVRYRDVLSGFALGAAWFLCTTDFFAALRSKTRAAPQIPASVTACFLDDHTITASRLGHILLRIAGDDTGSLRKIAGLANAAALAVGAEANGLRNLVFSLTLLANQQLPLAVQQVEPLDSKPSSVKPQYSTIVIPRAMLVEPSANCSLGESACVCV